MHKELQTDAKTTLSDADTQGARNGEVLSFPAALAQQAFWFLDQLEPGGSAFNVAVRFHLAGPLDVRILELAFHEMIQRHEILRTRFELEAGELKQVVLPSAPLKIGVIDLSPLPDDERRAETERQGSIEAHRPFRLAVGPLLRVNLLRLGPEEHMLQVTLHHAISDGWSIGLITEEIAAIYEALLRGQPCPLPPLPIQFADFTLWQRRFLEGPEIASQLEYWKKRLAGCEEPNLPTDRPRPQVKRWKGEIESILLPEELTARLQDIAQANGATLFMTFFAAFKVLLLRYTGQTDIAVGSPVVGRNRVETEKLIGVFINTVILRTDLSGNPAFSQALRAVRETAIEAMANQDVPFELLVKELNPNRDLGRNPLFQINFIHQRDFVKPVTFGGIALTAVPSRSPGAIFDMQFFMVERDGVWRASCEFNTGLFERETAIRMLGHFKQLLVSIAANPLTPIEQLEMLPAEERRRILVDWNNTSRAYPAHQTIVGLLGDQVRNHPSKRAVQCGERAMTYTELDQAANMLAARLRRAGAKPGVLVGLCLKRSIEMVVGVLAILKSGAAYVPMDPTYPRQRLEYMIEDAAMPIILTQSELASNLPAKGAKVLPLDIRSEDESTDDDGPGVRAEDLAYVIFTSGSTGRPKGVQIQHRALVNFLNSMRREPGMSATDVLLSVTTLSFDIAGLELFLPLTTGATVVVAEQEIIADPQRLKEEFKRVQPTIMQATPVTWRLLLESGWQGSQKLKCLVGGEAVPRELVNKLRPCCASLWNMYGPTETTVWSAVGRLESGVEPVRIGRPIDNTQIYVVSPTMNLQPAGVPGELLIGGDGLAAGYLNRDELTAEKFVMDPFSGRVGGRLYRTGDLARWHADGTLECLQRMDQQVKIRGFRIELEEIEAVLTRHPDVRHSVVVAKEDPAGERRLVAYMVPSAGCSPTSAELRQHVRALLPEYAVPSVFVLLERIPLTPNGKIDRKALPAPVTNLSVDASAIVAPRNPTEQRLKAIFSRVLQANNLSIHDSFFDLGGHSLLAVNLMEQIEREFSARLPLAQLFSTPTIAGLAMRVESHKAHPTRWKSLVPIQPGEGKPTLYLIHGAGGNVLLYRELAEALAADVSVYGFQAQGLDQETEPLTTVEEMAAHYLRELKAVQSSGPYHLGGYCLGGTIAYEMARLLRRDGEVVGLVALLDTYNFSEALPIAFGKFVRQKIGFHLRNLACLQVSDAAKYLTEKFRIAREGEFMGYFTWRDHLFGGTRATRIDLKLLKINDAAARAFRPQAFPGALTVFKPRVNYDIYPDPLMGWGNLALDGLQVVELPVNPHAMLVEPYVRHLAAELKSHLESSTSASSHAEISAESQRAQSQEVVAGSSRREAGAV